MSRVLITGVTGFVASHCASLFLKRGFRVRGTVRSLVDNPKLESLRKNLEAILQQNNQDDYEYSDDQLEVVEADLDTDEGWETVVEGCSYVLHIATRISFDPSVSERDIISTAVDGTLRVLSASVDVGCVKRIVLTSSLVAINGASATRDDPWTEADWTDATDPSLVLPAYYKAKTLAEKAAWEFVENLPREKGNKLELVALNPGLVVGPSLTESQNVATEPIAMLMENRLGFIPRIALAMVDVRDVALAQFNALFKNDAVGQRHILVGHHLWLEGVADILRGEYSSQGYDIPREVREFTIPGAPKYSAMPRYDTSRFRKVLGVVPRERTRTLVDMVEAMIAFGQIQKANITNSSVMK